MKSFSITMPKKNKTLISLYFIFIASLPFFSIRPSFLIISFPLVILAIMVIIILIKFAIDGRYIVKNGFFDGVLLLYLVIASVSSAGNDNHVAIIKSWVYFFAYIALKQIMIRIGTSLLIKATTYGIIFGTFLYIVLIGYAVKISNGLSSLFNDLSYYGFTYKIYQAISTGLLAHDDFQSADIMRNSIGEVFAFYFIFFIIKQDLAFISKAQEKIYLWVNFTFVLLTFSRRALIAILVSFALLNLKSKNIYYILSNIAILLISLYVFIFVLSGELRLNSLEDNSRISQYSYAIEKISNELVTGYGYGAKIIENNKQKYIHNFILASTYMMGALGFLLSLIIFVYVLGKYTIPIYQKNTKLGFSYLLVIPILGMGVGSTVEGIFTLTSWIIFAFYGATLNPANKASINLNLKNDL